MRPMGRKLPPMQIRFRWSHLFVLVDALLVLAIFATAGKWYLAHRGAPALAAKEEERRASARELERLTQQADSVVAARKQAYLQATQDSIRLVSELESRRQLLSTSVEEQRTFSEATSHIGSGVYELRQMAETEVQRDLNYDEELAKRSREMAEADSLARLAALELARAESSLTASTRELEGAHAEVAYEPRSILPERSGLLVRQEVRDGSGMTGVEFQQMLWARSGADVGLSLGLGLGGGDTESSKQLGLLVSRPLVHRRVGLDVGAGYSVLTDATGDAKSSPYASAAFRLSPWYRERFHLGLGARADQDGVQPFVGIALGRR